KNTTSSGFRLNGRAANLVDRPPRSQERLAGNLRLDRGPGRGFIRRLADERDEILAALEVVEADVDMDRGRSRDDVGRLARSLNRGDLEVGGLERVVAVVEPQGLQRGDHAGKLRHRIVGPVRIGDVAL